jgi:hypothetical protein
MKAEKEVYNTNTKWLNSIIEVAHMQEMKPRMKGK